MDDFSFDASIISKINKLPIYAIIVLLILAIAGVAYYYFSIRPSETTAAVNDSDSIKTKQIEDTIIPNKECKQIPIKNSTQRSIGEERKGNKQTETSPSENEVVTNKEKDTVKTKHTDISKFTKTIKNSSKKTEPAKQ